MSFIVTKEWLRQELNNDQENITVIDVRFDMAHPEAGQENYKNEHIPSAVYLDLNKDLSGPAEKHGGGHPLPDVHLFAKKLGDLGISNDQHIVVYDQDNGMFAGRAWWLLHYIGHEHVYVLDGGFKDWVEAAYDVTNEEVEKEVAIFTPHVRQDAIVDITGVKENVNKRSAILIDSRAKSRYLGEEEPMYAKAGHIPGAKNYFWKNVLNEDGTYKSKEELAVHFASLSKDEEIIVSCGSGVSACPNILVLKELGYENVKLYPGSFSDWISYEDNELETKEE